MMMVLLAFVGFLIFVFHILRDKYCLNPLIFFRSSLSKKVVDDDAIIVQALPNQKTTDRPPYRLVIIGDGGTGKTTFLKRHLIGEFEKKYEATNRVKTHPLEFYTNSGKIRFTCSDTVGLEINDNDINFANYVGSHCAIIMFDVTERLTYKNVEEWTMLLRYITKNIPVVLCGNKVDLMDRQVLPKEVTFHRMYKDMRYHEISVKSNYNIEMPFLCLARRLIGDPNLHFVEPPTSNSSKL